MKIQKKIVDLYFMHNYIFVIFKNKKKPLMELLKSNKVVLFI